LIGPKVKCIIQTLSETADDYGSPTKTWTNVKELRATLAPAGSGETIKVGREQMSYTHRLFLDYYRVKSVMHHIRPNGRVWIGSRLYDIIAIENNFNRTIEVLLRLEV